MPDSPEVADARTLLGIDSWPLRPSQWRGSTCRRRTVSSSALPPARDGHALEVRPGVGMTTGRYVGEVTEIELASPGTFPPGDPGMKPRLGPWAHGVPPMPL
jgi:hypothetical protein